MVSSSPNDFEPDLSVLEDTEDQNALAERLNQLKNLPINQQNEAILQELATLTWALQNAIVNLKAATKRDIEAESEKIKEEVTRTRKRVVFTILTSVLIAFSLALGTNNLAIKHCFLGTASQLHHDSLCNTIFPGYNQSIDREKAVLGQFSKLLQEPQKNAVKINDLKNQIVQLEKQLVDLEKRNHLK